MDPLFLDALAVWRDAPPQSKPTKARILLIHGISEHAGRHRNTIGFLNSIGVEVVSFDLRGAGLSGGRRQWIENFRDYIDDTVQVFNWINSSLTPLPLYVLGHSLGGAIATYFAAEYGKVLHGVILSAPAYLVGGAVSPIKIKASHYLDKVTPGLRVPKGGDSNAISRDPRAVKEYVNDPLCCHFNTVRQATQVLGAIAEIPKVASKITCPTLVVHGSGDQIIRVEGSFEILQKLTCGDRTLQIYPGGYHELHNDLDKEVYFASLELWIKERLR